MKPTAEPTMRGEMDKLSARDEARMRPIYDRLCALVERWRELATEALNAGNSYSDTRGHAIRDCADELATILGMEPKR